MKKILLAATLAATLALVGCTSAQIQADEAAVYSALVKAETAIDWVSANPDQVRAVVAQAVALDPTNKTLQAVQSKTNQALDSGALNLAHFAVVGGIALTAPVQQSVPAPPPLQVAPVSSQ